VNELLSAAEAAPEKQGRSKLEPFAAAVATLRRKRWSYREIADFLREKESLKVDPSTVFDFVKSLAKRGRRQREPLPPPVKGFVPAPLPIVAPSASSTTKQDRAVYIPSNQQPMAFSRDALKTNDELEEG
jgi:hypothetical protein